MVRTDSSSTFAAFTTQYLGSLSLGTCSTFCTGHLLNQRFLRYKVFSKLRHLFHACQVPFDYSWEWHTHRISRVCQDHSYRLSFSCPTVCGINWTNSTPQRTSQATEADSGLCRIGANTGNFHLQVSAQLPRWVDRQWELHQQTLQTSGHMTWDPKEIADAIRPLRALVRGPADHFPNSLFVACPVYYHQLLRKTFGDPAVFQPCKNGTARIVQHLRQDFATRHPELQVYDWAFQWNKGLPTARDPTQRIQTIQKGTADHRVHEMLAHQGEFISGYRIVFRHADTVSPRFYVERLILS